MTVTAGPVNCPRDSTGRGPRWLVITREGNLVDHRRFHTEAEAQAFADPLKSTPEPADRKV